MISSLPYTLSLFTESLVYELLILVCDCDEFLKHFLKSFSELLMMVFEFIPVILRVDGLKFFTKSKVLAFYDFEPLSEPFKLLINHKELLLPKCVIVLLFSP
jgi:hypothetical protein